MNVCIIPARGGSKRIPKKNIKNFCGRPIIEYSIDIAKESKLFKHIIVSTDNYEIAKIAEKSGAQVPFLRPDNLSSDSVPTRPVINHAINEIEKLWGVPDFVCNIYPTAPFLKVKDLIISFEILKNKMSGFVISIASFAYPIQRSFFIDKENNLKRFYPKYRFTRSQDLEEAYHDAGQFCWGTPRAFLDNLDPISENGYAYKLPRYRVHDIDTFEDWERAEKIYASLYKI